MKLRYAASFGKRAGSAWRLIFVYALMPWLQKYRIQARPESAKQSQFLSQFLTDPENQYPSMRFVSLRRIISAEADAEDSEVNVADSDDMNEKSEARTVMTAQELELEIKRLQEELAVLESLRKSEAMIEELALLEKVQNEATKAAEDTAVASECVIV